MGIDIDAVLIFGSSVDELEDSEAAVKAAMDGDLDYASPYYDSPSDVWLVGYSIYPPDLIDGTIGKKELQELTDQLLKYGITNPELMVSPHVW